MYNSSEQQQFKANVLKVGKLEDRAVLFAERYGITDYDIKDNKMIWYKNYPRYLYNPAYTVKHTLNLLSLNEQTQVLNKLNKRGWNN